MAQLVWATIKAYREGYLWSGLLGILIVNGCVLLIGSLVYFVHYLFKKIKK